MPFHFLLIGRGGKIITGQENQLKAINALLIEDNYGDVVLTKKILQTSGYTLNLDLAWNGEEALAFLRQERPFFYKGRPDLILLDIFLPRMNGWEFLSELKKDPALKDIPVLVISSSRESKDLEAANSFEVKHFIEKPLNSNQFTLLENFLRDIWIEKFGSDNGHLKGTF